MFLNLKFLIFHQNHQMNINYLKINHILFLLVIQSLLLLLLIFTDDNVFNSVLFNYNISIIPFAFGG